jgi:hypothetical protein
LVKARSIELLVSSCVNIITISDHFASMNPLSNASRMATFSGVLVFLRREEHARDAPEFSMLTKQLQRELGRLAIMDRWNAEKRSAGQARSCAAGIIRSAQVNTRDLRLGREVSGLVCIIESATRIGCSPSPYSSAKQLPRLAPVEFFMRNLKNVR